MKLFLISQSVNNNYDTYDSAVVAAENEEQARKIDPSGYSEWNVDLNNWVYKGSLTITSRFTSDWATPDNVDVEYIGEAKEGTEEGVICASFNAG